MGLSAPRPNTGHKFINDSWEKNNILLAAAHVINQLHRELATVYTSPIGRAHNYLP